MQLFYIKKVKIAPTLVKNFPSQIVDSELKLLLQLEERQDQERDPEL